MTMAPQIEQLVSKYRAAIQFPALSAAKIIQQCGSQLTISSFWSQRCLERTTNSKYSQTHIINGSQITHTPPVDSSTELLSVFSPSGLSRAVLREFTADEGNKKQHLEIWSDNHLSQLVDLTLLDQHGEVYISGEFSCLEWSSCERKLLYVAEKKQPKTEPFYPSKPKNNDNNTPDDNLPKKGEEHIYRQDWGETLPGKHHPVLCVCDLETCSVIVPSGVPDTLSVGQALWVPGGIVAVGWRHVPRRLGIVYCTSRPSCVFFLNDDGAFTKLSGEGLAAHSPRLSPDKDYLVWLQRCEGGPHHAAHQLVKQVWGALPHVLVDIVQTETNCASGHKFHGLYCVGQLLPARCFSDNCTLLLSTAQATAVQSYVINTEYGAVHQVEHETGSLTVLDVCGDRALFSLTMMNTPVSLYLGHICSSSSVTLTPVLSRDPLPSPTIFNSLQLHILDLEADPQDSFRKFNALYYGPSEGDKASVPLIVWPHGGPHSNFVQGYSAYIQFFINAGFATLQVNYRGSTGLGQASVDFLLGQVGDTDVKDCHQAALSALSTFPCLDPTRVVLFGGSHGGFLVTHLSGQYPDFYRAVVARNPVVDVVSAYYLSDIPDWAVVEGGFIYTGKEQVEMTPDFLTKLRKVSPIQYASKVKAPTLLNIGKKDLRVPPSQGMLYYHTLKTYDIPCKMNLYNDNHSLSTVPVDIDAAINAVLWFQEHLEGIQ